MAARPRTSAVAAAALVVASLVVTFLGGEVAIRIVHPSASLWRYPNYIALATRADPDQPDDLLRYDAELGWEPRPEASDTLMHQTVSFSADGLRNQNRGLATRDGPPILAVGDSYTEGFAVADDQSWPAHLERRLGRRVLNGGVHGYGLDQAVLRADRLARTFHPPVVVLGFIADDVDRTGLSIKSWAHKPFFVVSGDDLELRNVPVPQTDVAGSNAWPRRILGYSYLLDFTMRRLGAHELWYGTDRSTGQDTRAIACRLMYRFAQSLRGHGAEGLVVALPQASDWDDPTTRAADQAKASHVLDCARQQGLRTLDAYGVIERAAQDPRSLYVDWHLNDAGNAAVARLIAEALGR
jgi:hypothetical protein